MPYKFNTNSVIFSKIIANNVCIDDVGIFTHGSPLTISSANVPTRDDSPGLCGDIAFDPNYFYICTNENKWKYAELMAPCVAPEWSQDNEVIDVIQGNYSVNYQSTLSENQYKNHFNVDDSSADIFFIDSNTGKLFFRAAPDFDESENIYVVTITATNKAGSKDLTLTINIVE